MTLENINSPSHQSNLLNAQLLNRVRFIAIISQLLLISLAVLYLDVMLPLEWLIGIVLLETIFQLYSYNKVKNGSHIHDSEIFVHILLDSLILASLVYLSGGANNPFTYFLLLFVALGTFVLKPRYLLLISTIELILYSLLNMYQRPLELGDSSPLELFRLHLAGMWLNFGLTTVLIAVFGLLARHSMLKQEKKIQELREKQLKDEQILSLGIMSASAAHELGTPLATMAIVVDDLNHETDASKRVRQDMVLLANQIENCRNIIRNLNKKSDHTRKQLVKQKVNQNDGGRNNLKAQLEAIFENWLVYRPQVVLTQHWQDNFESINHHLTISVEQAVTNLMNNAADASVANSSGMVEVNCSVEQQQLIIEITDFGAGLTPTLRASLGANIQESKKADGFGWGLFLSNASIERMGGKVHLTETSTGGTLTRINLPMVENKE